MLSSHERAAASDAPSPAGKQEASSAGQARGQACSGLPYMPSCNHFPNHGQTGLYSVS